MKKKLIISLSIISFGFAYSQNTVRLNESAHETYFKINSQGAQRELTYDEIEGSPYPDKNFSLAKVADNYPNVAVRYNSYRDDIEFKKDATILVLPKEAQFYRIEIFSPKQTLVYLDTHDGLTGYFFEVLKGKNSLYKKIKTKFNDITPAANSYTATKPASFKIQDPVYYIKTEKGLIKNPKEIAESFTEQKNAIKDFIKANKIKLNKEEDLIKLVNFLNQA